MHDHLPPEIVLHILALLDLPALLVCTRVSRRLRALVTDNVAPQYTIELAVAGMQDGPRSLISTADRLSRLRNSQAAWRTLQWSARCDVRMLPGSLYELYGGVLVQSTYLSGRRLVFRSLPSHIRSLDERVWALDFDVFLRDFTLDPAQDLIALITQPVLRPDIHNAQIEVAIHLRSLTTGKVHPLATRPPVLVHDVDLHAATLTFMIQIHSDRIAVHFISNGFAPSELVVWNWKTGEKLLNTYGDILTAFSFLTHRFVLVGGFDEIEFNLSLPRLFVIDIDASNGERTNFDHLEYLCSFLYPGACHPWVQPQGFLIRSDPSGDWAPHSSVQVPFSIGPGPRLYIITIWVGNGEDVSSIDLFVLSSTLLKHVDALGAGETRRDIEWFEWGPNGTRMILKVPHSRVWVCYVFGTRFSTITAGEHHGRASTLELEVWDFNQLGIRRDMGLAKEAGPDDGVEWHVGDTSVVRNTVFMCEREVQTRLPYRVTRRALPAPLEGGPIFTEAMCSEDSVILVDTRSRQFGILTF